MGLWDGISDYFGADAKAGRAQRDAANTAQGYVQGGYDQSIGIQEGLAGQGMGDYNQYRQNVQQGAYGTDPSQYQTQVGQGPQFQGYQAGQGPQFQGSQFQNADAGIFQFDYEQSPSYQFQMEQGLNAIKGNASAIVA